MATHQRINSASDAVVTVLFPYDNNGSMSSICVALLLQLHPLVEKM